MSEGDEMKIYLASRYSRIDELNVYAEELRQAGHEVTSRWLLGKHQWDNDAQAVEAATESVPVEAKRFASEDVEDLQRADVVIAFSETPRGNHSRGGRHVEFGMALALYKRLVVIGPRENVFHCLPQVSQFPLGIF